jgi:cysteine desulfurase
MTVYFDNAATTKLEPELQEKLATLMLEDFGNPNSIHSYGRKARKIIEEARLFFSNYLNCDESELIFTSCASESNNYFLKHFPCDLLVTSPSEHSCVLESAKASAKKLYWLKLDKFGCVDKEDLENVLSQNFEKKVLVSLMYGNNEIGSVNDLEYLSSLKDKYPNLVIHSDCVQALTKLDLDLSKLNLDSISCSAHKVHGPKGVGLIYLSKKVQGIMSLKNLALIHGGGQESGFRSGTQNVPGIAIFAEAVKISQKQNSKKILLDLDKAFVEKAKETRAVVFNSPLENKVPGIFNIYLPKCRLNSEELVLQLDLNGFCISSGSACSSLKGDAQIISSYVLRACGFESSIAEKSIRVSLSRHNTLGEINEFFKIITKISEKFTLK